ncbi:MAG TPA: YkgJ family cysteine cluster protein [Verrucomicrobiae bacterium]|nr:YkgJ family cysteine cluster protein [Verrucomicrobiae bacterium]
MNPADANSLCLECGLCCNGVIFADVQLQSGDNAARLRTLGLALLQRANSGNEKFKQPCTAFAGCQCNIYSERPTYCREFECLLLKSVKAGKIDARKAIPVIRSALRRVKKVERLLQQLGDADESVALSKRFRRMQRKLEGAPLDRESAQTFGELTLAVHDLNLLLAEKFYPAP